MDFLGLRLRFDWRWGSHWKDKAGLEPEQRVQAWVQTLEGGSGESQTTNHQVACPSGTMAKQPGLI